MGLRLSRIFRCNHAGFERPTGISIKDRNIHPLLGVFTAMRITLVHLSVALCFLVQMLPVSTAGVRVVLVGVSEHDDNKIPSLPQAGTDMKDLVDALHHAGIHRDAEGVVISQLFGTALTGGTPPTQKNILQALSQQTESASPDDILLFYFTGHAILDATGNACLVPSDAVVTGSQVLHSVVSVSDLRTQMEASPAAHKIVIIDSCYSGSFARLSPVVPISLAFTDANLYAITSSADDEVSVVWPSRRQSLATRWLCHGLRGGADQDMDGTVSMDEFFGFLEQNVATSFPIVQKEIEASPQDGDILRQLNQRTQTPCRMIGPPWTNPRLFVMQPHSAEEAIRSLAMQLADRIIVAAQLRNLGHDARVAVLPAVSLSDRDVKRGQYPILEQLVAPRLTTELLRHGQGQFETLNAQSVSAALTKSFSVTEIDHQKRSEFRRVLEAHSTEVDFFVHTRLLVGPQHLTLQTELLSASGGTIAYRTSVVVGLSSELRDSTALGSIGVQPPLDLHTGGLHKDEPEPRPSQKPADISEPARQPQVELSEHPYRTDYENFPVHVTVQVKDQSDAEHWHTVKMESDAASSDAVFGVRDGENLKLIVRNQTDRHLAAVVFVDGINVLGKKPQTPAEALHDSGYWILEPHYTAKFDGLYVRENSQRSASSQQVTGDFAGNYFLVADAPKSVASQLSYSDSVGDIRIHLYETQPHDPSSKQVGFTEGRRVDRSLRLHRIAGMVNNPAGTLVFKYIEAIQNHR